MFSTSPALLSPLRRFRPQGKIPVIIVKDYIPMKAPPPSGLSQDTSSSSDSLLSGTSPIIMNPVGRLGNRPYFAGERRRVSRGVMRYVLYPNKIAVYETPKAKEDLRSFLKKNPHFPLFLKEKKTLFALERYLKTKSLIISEPITKSIIKRHLNYALNLKINNSAISISKAKKSNLISGLVDEDSRKSSTNEPAYGKYTVSVTFHPVGYVMRFPAWYHARGQTYNKFAIEKLNMREKDSKMVAEAKRTSKLESAEGQSKKMEARNFMDDAADRMYIKKKVAGGSKKEKKAADEKEPVKERPVLTEEQLQKKRERKQAYLEELRTKQLQRLSSKQDDKDLWENL